MDEPEFTTENFVRWLLMTAPDSTTDLGRFRLVPVVEIDDPQRAVDLGAALVAGGLPCAEITFRTAGAGTAIAALARSVDGLLVGAGTVLTTGQVDAALDAGASFLVAPGFNPAVVEHALARGARMIPGVCTPSEIEMAMAMGLTTMKFFPAEVSGGVRFLTAVAPVYQAARFIPTGGIGPANLLDYLALPAVLACGGSWMVKRQLIADGRFDEVARLVREAVDLVASAGPGTPLGGAHP